MSPARVPNMRNATLFSAANTSFDRERLHVRRAEFARASMCACELPLHVPAQSALTFGLRPRPPEFLSVDRRVA